MDFKAFRFHSFSPWVPLTFVGRWGRACTCFTHDFLLSWRSPQSRPVILPMKHIYHIIQTGSMISMIVNMVIIKEIRMLEGERAPSFSRRTWIS